MYNIVFVWNQRQAAANELVGAFKHQIRDALKHRISHVTWSHWVFFGGAAFLTSDTFIQETQPGLTRPQLVSHAASPHGSLVLIHSCLEALSVAPFDAQPCECSAE